MDPEIYVQVLHDVINKSFLRTVRTIANYSEKLEENEDLKEQLFIHLENINNSLIILNEGNASVVRERNGKFKAGFHTVD